ncbi:MAG TPA: hypothetical protein VLG11_02070 [Candidatus Saccharimonadales bacterium]|nr:hypothetical protein [Candidatus Saccharimonadales bacterium]
MSKTPSAFLDRFAANRRAPLYLYAAGAILLILSIWLWWAKVSIDPQRVFRGMLANSLSTSGVTFNLVQGNANTDGAAPDGSKEVVQVQFGAHAAAHARSTLTQNNNTVTTEAIGTTAGDYTRYLSIKTANKDKNGKPVDVSAVQNVWAKTTPAEAAANQNTPLFTQVVLGIGLPLGSVPMPMADLTPAQRAALLQQIQNDNVYSPDFAKVKKGSAHGRLAYAYPVTLQPITYARMMKTFAGDLGLHNLDNFDPNSLTGAQPIELTFVVDAHARQLVEVDYATTSYKETYSNYGAITPLQLPTQTITNAELQKRLAALE